jgi:phage gp45-like
MATKPGVARTNESTGGEQTIVLQVGTELRITNNGEIILSNPELELAREERAADATLLYKFDPNKGEHSFRLVEPFADHKHMKKHKPGD